MLQVLGRLHPLLVHFPIALLLAALAAECLRPRTDRPNETALFCLALGTLGAIAAAVSGWLFAAHDPPGMPDLLLRHRWSGVGAAAAAGATLVSAWRWKHRGTAELARPTRVGLVLTALLVGATGYMGGTMVYGEGFVLEPWREARRVRETLSAQPLASAGSSPPASSVATSAPSPTPPANSPALPTGTTGPARDGARAPVDYLTEIRPVFERRCFECHGNRKRPKGDLRLSDLASVLAREPSAAALVPGDPEASLIYRRLVLPAEHEDLMPPEDGPLPAEEIELVRRWIEEGAHWSAPAPAAGQRGDALVPEPALTLSEAERNARDAALARLRSRGARAQRIARTSEEVEVDLGVAAPVAGDADLALLAGLEPCLVELSLARCTVSAAGLASLASFQALRRLRLEHTALGDDGLAHLAGLRSLESLNLFATRVTDAGLASLGGLERLARLYTGETTLGDAALDELGRVRPGLTIERGRSPRLDSAVESR